MSKSTKELTLGGIMTALGVVLLCLGGALNLFVYIFVVLACGVLFIVREECSARMSWACFAATAVLAVLLCPDKECAALYCFIGYYPLLKPKMDTIKPKALRIGAKMLLFTVAIAVMYFLLLYVFGLTEIIEEAKSATLALTAVTFALGLLTFMLCDFLLSRAALLYRRRKK